MNTIKLKNEEPIPEYYTGIIEWENGTKYWYKEGKQHRIDGPACEWDNGDKFWYKEGLLHRIDGPAIEYQHGAKFWYIDDNHYHGSKTIEILLSNSIFLSAEPNGKYNIPWLLFLTEQGITEHPILPGYPYSLRYINKFVSSLPDSIQSIIRSSAQ